MSDDNDYSDVLRVLDGSSKTLRAMSNEDMLALVNELLSVFKTEWENVKSWSEKEARLLGQEKTSAGPKIVAGNRLGVLMSCKNFLETRAAALVYEIEKESADGVSKVVVEPLLLRTVREENGATVYGPIPLDPFMDDTFEVFSRPASIPSKSKPKNGVTVVLGAGNVSLLTFVDTLQNILVDRSPVLLKHHPLRPYLMEPMEVLFDPFAKRGFFAQVIDKGVAETQRILSNPLCGHVHMTGGYATSKAIKKVLQSSYPDKTSGEIDAMVTSELGCASPFILLPSKEAKFEKKELVHCAQLLVGGKKFNGGHNCLSPQVLIVPKHWDQKEKFLELVKDELIAQPSQKVYYPGCEKNKNNIVSSYKDDEVTILSAPSLNKGEKLGPVDDLALLRCGTPGEDGYNGVALRTEAFGPVLAVVELNGLNDDDDYANDVVVPFVNDKTNIFGSLSCSVAVPQSHRADPSVRRALSSLRYGAVCVNTSPAFGYNTALMGGVWGANALDETGESGQGFVGNIYGIPSVEKVVVHGPDMSKKAPLITHHSLIPVVVVDCLTNILVSQSTLGAVFSVVKTLLFSAWCSTFGIFFHGSLSR